MKSRKGAIEGIVRQSHLKVSKGNASGTPARGIDDIHPQSD
jgi:hypothetical protein